MACARWRLAWALLRARSSDGRRCTRPAEPERSAPGRTGARRRNCRPRIKRLTTLLLDGATAQGYATELWTLARVAQVIEREFGVSYCTTGVWLLLGRLGWSCQKPERQARERNDAEIARWRRVTWPKLRKRRRA